MSFNKLFSLNIMDFAVSVYFAILVSQTNFSGIHINATHYNCYFIIKKYDIYKRDKRKRK